MNDAGGLWQMAYAPVHGGPFCIDEFDDHAIRFSLRGLRGVQMAQSHGIIVTNRRYRGELRARFWYGHLEPNNPPFVRQS